MLSMGAIDRGTYETAVGTEPVLRDALRREEGFGLYFKEEVRRQLVEQFGWERVYHGGLRVYTTIDPGMQKVAEAQVARALEEIQTRKGSGRDGAADEPLQAALVAMDPQTGEVRALVGGRDFHQSTFNRATQARRQPGSAFKPFVYAAALEAGYSPASIITNLNDPIPTREGDWVPEDGHFEDPEISMRVALRVSSNRAAVRMLEEVGIPAAVQYAKRLGVGSVPSVPSMALGSGEVTLLSITAGYGTFANRGLLPGPTLIRRVEEADGTLLYEWTPSAHRAISEATAFLMTTMLADVIDRGTAWTARREGFTLPAAGKTGTTNDYYDAWFVGYTPNLVAGVWVGYDQPKTIIGGGYAAELAVPLWARFMAGATEGHPPDRFEQPPTVTTARVCRLTGKLAGDGCRDAVYIDEDGDVTRGSLEYVEYFAHGTEPVDDCPFHAPGGIGFLATTGTATQAPTVQPGTPATLGRIPSVAAQEATSGEPASGREPDGDREADAERQAEAEPEPVPEPERRRGFWGRLFRR
jgi:penicillin-binding protein 1A